MNFERAGKFLELFANIALICGIPIAVFDDHHHAVEVQENAQKERIEAAEKVYETVDEHFTEFVKLCIDHPRLDCYSVANPSGLKPPLRTAEKVQQKVLYAHLTDLFEVAFVQYRKEEQNTEIRKLYQDQWAGWDAYIRKFLNRPAYLATWYEVKDEYSESFVKYMDGIAPPPPRQNQAKVVKLTKPAGRKS